jgi:hypothetical protein
MIRNIIKGMSNLFKYFKIIWNDRDWDNEYIFILLKKKLEHTANYLEKNDYYVDVAKDVKRIRFCVRCIDRIIKEDYIDINNNLLKKYGEHDFRVDGEYFIFSRKNIKTEEEQAQYDKEFKRYSDIGDYISNRDLRLLFGTLEKYIKYWWD